MIDRRQRLIQIFEDTQQFIKENPILSQKAEKARKATEFYPVDEYPTITALQDKPGAICVSKHRTFEAAVEVHRSNLYWKTAVLNFASATNPGGGVTGGGQRTGGVSLQVFYTISRAEYSASLVAVLFSES